MSGTTQAPLNYPVVMTRAGVLPQAPVDLLAQLINLVTFGTDPSGNKVMVPTPGYTAGLPGSLIEDISSTDTAAMILMDQARVELINSLTPFGANAFLMNQLGQLFGIPSGSTVNVSVGLKFSGTVGYMIQRGFQVSDGSRQFIVQTGGIIGADSTSAVITAVATQSGSFPVPAGTVTQLDTSVPSSITLNVTNPLDGTGGTTIETEQAYRLRVLQASVAACQGTPAFLKTQLQAVSGVVPNQVGVQAVPGGGWKIICGGSSPDPYAIGNAIYQGVPDLGMLQGSVMGIDTMTRANPGVATTVLNHGYATGQRVTFANMNGMAQLNTGTYTLTVIDALTFSIGFNTTGLGTYQGGGSVSPNLRNKSVTITDFPDTYTIPYVVPPSQQVQVVLTWNAVSQLVAGQVISQLAQAAIVDYINNIFVGAPINIFAMQEAVQIAVAPLIPLSSLSVMQFLVTINGIATAPVPGTGVIEGDPESYFVTTPAQVTVTQAT